MMRWTLLVFGLLLSACLPIPQVKLELDLPKTLYLTDPMNIRTAYVSLPGYPEPSTPEQYNKALYLRYFLDEAADTILVLMPGIFGGASSVDILARQLVAAIPGLEVWAIDRRANLLEDRRMFIESLRSRDPMPAYQYYLENFNKPDGFRLPDPEDLGFIRNWTLEVHLFDLHEVIKKAKSDAKTVILGGHSLGGSIVGFYAAFDFNPAAGLDPGYSYLDGLLLIDGALGRTGGFDREPRALGLGPLELIPGAEALAQGEGSPYLTFGLGPHFYLEGETLALFARFKPDELYLDGDFPQTNRAALGIREDDQYSLSTVFSSSFGHVVGAKLGGNITPVLLGGLEGIYSQTVIGVAEGHAYVDWERGDPNREKSRLEDVAMAWSNPYTNRAEWYFPLRLALDIGQYDVRLADAPGFIPNEKVTTATLAVGAGRGLIPELEGFAAYQNARPGSLFSSYILPAMTHLDMVQAEDNLLVPLFARWLEQIRKLGS